MPGKLLRVVTAGSVDDGKSTLVGRLLHDAKAVLSDQLSAVEAASERRGYDGADLALLVDGLRAEREQGITIDVAYRYFATARRTFILADTPGHVQYTRNTVTGASTADVAVILVDARNGVVEQTKRHAAVARLLRVEHVVLAVNKMDLVGYAEDVFDEIVDRLRRGRHRPRICPASPRSRSLRSAATTSSSGSANMPWYDGPALLEYLEGVEVHTGSDVPARLPVQIVIRPRTCRESRLPRLRRAGRGGHATGRRQGRDPSVRAHEFDRGDRHTGRRTERGRRRALGRGSADRRRRHRPG